MSNYNQNLPAGTYHARALNAGAYETPGGALMIGIEWEITDGEFTGNTITSRDCLVSKTGIVIEKKIAMMRKWAKGWDGIDTDWFAANFATFDVEIVIERRFDNYRNAEVPDVKYINAPGGTHGNSIPQGDAGTLKAKFGAKLRAAVGIVPKPVSVRAQPPKPAQAKPKPAPQKAKEVPPPDMNGERDAAWNDFTTANKFTDSAARNAAWFAMLTRAVPGKTDYNAFTAEDWAKVRELIKTESNGGTDPF